MSRAKWKGPYVSNTLILTVKKNKLINYEKEIYTNSRNSTIIPIFVGCIFNVHNGKQFIKFKITENMIGKKLGDFSPTRKKFSFKKKKIK
jgi:ribosomal protein S19